MPIYSATTALNTDFDGLTALTGLFDPGATTGARNIQVKINSLSFSGPSAITTWTVNRIDPSDDQTTVVLTGTGITFAMGGPAGFELLPTNNDGAPWQWSIVTTGLVGTGIVKIDFDFTATPG